MKNKKIIKKVKLMTKNAAKQTGIFMKKADKEAGKAIKVLKKEWERERPQREVYKKEASKAGKKGLKLLNEGIKNSKKIGGDVAGVIKKDIKEIYKRNKNSK